MIDELGDRGFALGEATDDPEPVHVGEGPVDEADRPEIIRLVDDGGDRGADAGARGAQGMLRSAGGGDPTAIGSIWVYINMR